jgi:hypothetical protein
LVAVGEIDDGDAHDAVEIVIDVCDGGFEFLPEELLLIGDGLGQGCGEEYEDGCDEFQTGLRGRDIIRVVLREKLSTTKDTKVHEGTLLTIVGTEVHRGIAGRLQKSSLPQSSLSGAKDAKKIRAGVFHARFLAALESARGLRDDAFLI